MSATFTFNVKNNSKYKRRGGNQRSKGIESKTFPLISRTKSRYQLATFAINHVSACPR